MTISILSWRTIQEDKTAFPQIEYRDKAAWSPFHYLFNEGAHILAQKSVPVIKMQNHLRFA